MKRILLVFCFLLFAGKLFAQQFSQYNTGTLYDSFENPAQKAFITDSSRQFASNFFVPNININFFLSGNGQATLKNRAFLNQYDNSLLQINQGKYNIANLNANAYLFMIKMFTSFNGDEEIGFSAQTRGEGRGLLSDETLAAFNGVQSFNSSTYNNIFNDRYYYQTYNQLSFTYREKINKQLSVGFKFNALLGVEYQKLNITSSQATYNKLRDTVGVALKGTYYAGFSPGHISTRDYLPTFRNPGASISMGAIYKTEDNFVLQGNIKDLGFIHWSKRSLIYDFDSKANIIGLNTPAREDSIYNKVYRVIRTNGIPGSFNTPVDGRVELSVNKSFWLDDDRNFKYAPTVIASKELFYPGFIGALVNPIQYRSYVLTLTTSYDDLKTFNVGLQAMYKTPNFEIYLGSEKLSQSTALLGDAFNKTSQDISQNSGYTGFDFFLGFSMKFGPVIEHPMNASTIPMGDKGFLARLWNRLFKTYQ